MKGIMYGYIRVSTREQKEDRQLAAMREFGVEERRVVVEKRSGKDFDRPRYQALVNRMDAGDVLVVKSIDRLGRNYEEVLEQWRILTKDKGVDIVVLDMPLLDTRREKNLLGTFIADLVLQLLSFMADSERTNIRSRQQEGIEAAKQRGVQFGRPAKPLPENFAQVYRRWMAKEISAEEAAKVCNLTTATFYRRARMQRGGES